MVVVGAAVPSSEIGDLLNSSSFVVIGASDKNVWTKSFLENAARVGFAGRIELVTRDGREVAGRSTLTSCVQLEQPVDTALIAVPSGAVLSALRDAGAAGIRSAVILAGGFGELGEEGKQRQQELVDVAQELGITFIGPNCLGYVNLLAGSAAWFGAYPPGLEPGSVAIVSQSGSLAVAIAGYASRQGVGVSHVISTGNEASQNISGAVQAVVADPQVRAVAVFAESIRDPQEFLHAASLAVAANKPIVMLKTGSSSIGAELAMSHTGSIVGDADVVAAGLRGAGVVMVDSIEELVQTASLIAHTGVLPPGGVGILSSSGGVVDIAADRADALAIPLPDLNDGSLLSDRIVMRNPLDLTGYAYGDRRIVDEAFAAFDASPAIAFVVYGQTVVPTPDYSLGGDEFLNHVAQGMAGLGARGVLVGTTSQTLEPAVRAILSNAGVVHATTGMYQTLASVKRCLDWSAFIRTAKREPPSGKVEPRSLGDRTLSKESQVLEFLAEGGLPVVPWRHATTSEEAQRAAQGLGYPVAVKASGEGLLHKSVVGGVRLGVDADAGVAESFESIMEALSLSPGVVLDGVLVSPMRVGGGELLVSYHRDPEWGGLLTIAAGGVGVSTGSSKAVVTVKASAPDLDSALGQIPEVSQLLADESLRKQVVDFVVGLSRLAVAYADDLDLLEINPLLVTERGVEALDGLAIVTASRQG